MPEWWKLAGLAVLIAGMALRARTTVVVAAAALVTGVAAGLPLFTAGGKEGILDMLGRGFADNRLMTLFLITLPAIGLAERHGLQEESARLIRSVRAATAGRLLIVYQLFRVLHGIAGLRLNGHPIFVRPLVYPMALGASLPGADAEKVKAASAAAENYGNFYGQNLSPVQPGILLVYGVLGSLGFAVSVWDLVLYAIPVALLAILIGAAQFIWFDRARGKRR